MRSEVCRPTFQRFGKQPKNDWLGMALLLLAAAAGCAAAAAPRVFFFKKSFEKKARQ
jgi:hypothetical protein